MTKPEIVTVTGIRQLGDPRQDAMPSPWVLMPCCTAHGECSQCGVVHEPDEPHDAQSLHYRYVYYSEHGRFPIWTDAIAHCAPETRELYAQALREHGVEI